MGDDVLHDAPLRSCVGFLLPRRDRCYKNFAHRIFIALGEGKGAMTIDYIHVTLLEHVYIVSKLCTFY